MSSSSSISATTVSGTTRITGLSSGLDVDSIVEQLMTAEKAKKLNKLQQKEQLAEWKQEAYRDIIADIQAFTSKYFNTTSSTSLLSQKSFKQYTVTSSSSSAVTASYTSAAGAGSHSIAVSQLATAATLASSASISGDVRTTSDTDYSSLAGKSFVITVDGVARTISFGSDTDFSGYTTEEMADYLQTAVDAAVGENKVTVTGDDDTGLITFTAAVITDADGATSDSGVQAISVSTPGSGTSALAALGFGSGSVRSNRVDTTAALSEIFDSSVFNDDGQIALTINGVSFTFDAEEDSLKDMISEINAGDCGATLAYDELSGKLVLTASDTGAGAALVLSEPEDAEAGQSSLLSILNTATAGLDAKITLDGKTLTRSSNTITVDGVTYTLNATTSEAATVSLTQDVDGICDLITGFVEDYNALIATINSALQEDYDSDYPPLTDDQKEEMTDEEIEKWEAKAKTGILENDSLLTNFLRELRSTMVDSISGLSTTIFDLGIDTGDYDEKGKLEIDEDALKEAIQTDPQAIINLFTKQSAQYSGTSTVRKLDAGALTTRYNEEGLAYRFYDILAKYTSTIRDNSGNKGLMLEKAGVDEDASDTDNTLTTEIEKYQKALAEEEDRLDDYEEKLYAKYTTLETYISKMNAQLSALQSYTSSSS